MSLKSSGLILPRDGPWPRPTILFLVKFLRKEEHVDSLLDGKLYAKRLACFKKLEADQQSGRSDPDEGTSSWMQPGQVSLEINGWDMTGDLAGARSDAADLARSPQRVLRSCGPHR